ncbi:MAG: carbohydrate binding domain-containing protein [Eubacterium sp.]|nr:carbohydrate binding domain-containing protein [Eubacterium sp.]
MKHFLKSICKPVLAIVLAVSVICLGGCSGSEPQPENPNINKITDYSVENANYTLSIDASNEIHDISDMLFGIFFEDINFAADGGLYAEKIANRSFEFTELAVDDQLYRWRAVNNAGTEVKINDTENCLNENNTNYLVLTNSGSEQAGIENLGFLDGLSVNEGEEYNFSLYAKGIDGYTAPVTVRIVVSQLDDKGNKTGEIVAGEAQIDSITDKWAKYELSLTSTVSANENVSLQVLIENGSAAFDMISLFPVDTYKGRENGLRNDLASLLEELQPKFLRFPGGCVIEGYDENTAYKWKDSVGVGSDGLPLEFNGKYGDVAVRKQGENIWTDHAATDDEWPSFMTYGLGFYEYFQLAEDIGAVGVPVLDCGLYCQMRGMGPIDMDTDLFKQYVQDMLDLVEFCRGDASTTWGKVRADLGHTEPFELKYICIGNENEGDDYFVRYKAFLDAFNAAKAENPALYEGIELIYSSGASAAGGANYLASYEYAKEQLGDSDNATDFAGATDHHYYCAPEWFLDNTDYYDENNYSRDVDSMTDTPYGGAINVFLGEYASQSNTLKSALSEAAYMTGLERNGDIVRMAAYAPLFSSTAARHWAPDLIWFSNNASVGSTSYYIQKLFSTNTGSKLLSSEFESTAASENDFHGKVGLGTWNTSAEFDNVKIVNNLTGEVLGEDDFSGGKSDFKKNWERATDGKWKIVDGKLQQQSLEMEYSENGSVVYFGDTNWSNYTYTFEATKLDGAEGFIIPFAVKDKNTNYFWNLGGWENTVSCLQHMQNGFKFGQDLGTVKPFTAETGTTYNIKIVVDGTNIKCYVDDELYIDYDAKTTMETEAYQVVSTDESGDIIVKLVNVTGTDRTYAVDISGAENISDSATVYQVAGDNLEKENVIGEDDICDMKEFTVSGFSNSFNYTVPKYSATVIRIPRG